MKKPNKTKQAYYIWRESHMDDSKWFNDHGRRVWFEKAAWATWLMGNFDSDQKAKVVIAPVLEADLSYRDFLVSVLPEHVTPDEYLSAIERTIRDRRSGKDISKRAARSFLERMRRQSSSMT